MLGARSGIVALAKKITKPETKTVTRNITIPKKWIVNQSQGKTPNKVNNSKKPNLAPYIHVLSLRYLINEKAEISFENS